MTQTMTQVGVLQTIQVGTPQRYGTVGRRDRMGRPWETSFFRTPSEYPRWLYTTHLDGSAQSDTKNHGRPFQAVLLYAAAHYPLWQEELGLDEIGPGGFGENFTVEELSETTACIGDTYAIGEAQIQVTMPRYPCWKIERRWDRVGLTNRVAETGRTGWYCRVLREGLIEPGKPILLVERPYPQWTVALANDFAYGRNRDVRMALLMAACPLLADFWPELVVRGAFGKGQE